MRRLRLWVLLLAAAATNAAAGTISLEVPLSPSPSGLSGAAALSPLANTFPLALTPNSPWGPTVSLAASLQSPPPGAIPLATALKPMDLRPAALLPHNALKPKLSPSHKPKLPYAVIESLRAHGAESGKLSKLDGENGKNALERNFLSAASLGDGVPVDGGKNGSGDGSELKPKADARPLLERLLERVQLDDRGRPEERKALEDAVAGMLKTPTGRRYAEEFLAEGHIALVHFEDFPDSQLFLVDGRKRFYAAQAYTDWRAAGYSEIRLNRHYIDGDPEYLRDSLPGVLGHELLGHGLWYGRAAKDDLYLAFHYHELNETHARVVGWSIDYELDGRIEEQGAWTYLQDPVFYLTNLKMRLPYYAVTFSQREMVDAIGSMKTRLEAAENELTRAKEQVLNHKTWLPVLDHFAAGHGIAESRFTLLRQEMNDLVTHYENDVAVAEAIIREVTGLIERMEAEPGRDSQIYLQRAAENPFFKRLHEDMERATAALKHSIANAAPVEVVFSPSPRPKDQITWQQLSEMYHKDLADDAKRPAGKKHWSH